MKRNMYFDNISRQLSVLQFQAQNESKLTLHNTNVFAEDFYCDLLNCVYGWSLVNVNAVNQNAEGIDLIDEARKLFVQVSATSTSAKVKHSLKELKDKSEYSGFRFKFLSIARAAGNLRRRSFNAPNGISFDPQSDVMDVSSLLRDITHMGIDQLAELNALVDKELGVLGQTMGFPSGLSYVVSKLAQINLEDSDVIFDLNQYSIDEKIRFNNIGYWEDVIKEYKVYINQLRDIYSDYDELGKNKSLAIQDTLKTIYRKSKRNAQGEELFDIILEKAFSLIRDVDDVNMTEEDVKLYLKVILVDAFIECQIFEKPVLSC